MYVLGEKERLEKTDTNRVEKSCKCAVLIKPKESTLPIFRALSVGRKDASVSKVSGEDTLRHLLFGLYASDYAGNSTKRRRLRYDALRYTTHATPHSRLRQQAYAVSFRSRLLFLSMISETRTQASLK